LFSFKYLFVYGQIDKNLEIYKPNSHVDGIVTPEINVTVSSGASHMQDNQLVLAVVRNQPQNDILNGHRLLALAL
jgi:hypothetical protein